MVNKCEWNVYFAYAMACRCTKQTKRRLYDVYFRILNSFLEVSCFNLCIFAVNGENSLHSL